jgi:hypothetical protein
MVIMTSHELAKYLIELPYILRYDIIKVRSCVDGKLYDIDEIQQVIYDNKPTLIIDIKSEE